MSAGERWLIVNADDLGRTTGINQGIFEAHRRGIVSSATLMVGFPAAAEAASELRSHPALGVGLHVTLTGARPTLAPESVATLVDRSGRFPPRPEGILDPDPGELRREIRNQLAIFHDLVGRAPTHLDSHHHSHRRPAVLEALVEIARERRLPVRSSSPAVAARLAEARIASTDAFVERFFDADARLEVLLAILDQLGAGSTELMCHPARVDDELRGASSYAEPRQRELAVLTAPEALARLARLGIRLTRFDELPRR